MNRLRKILCVVMLALVAALGTAFVSACNKESTPKYTVTFMVGTETYETLTGEEGATLTAPADPDVATYAGDGYAFAGWSTSSNGSVTELPTTFAAENVTYYARFSKQWTVTFDANGGTLSTTSIKVTQGASLYDAISSYTPTAESGLTFAGWYNSGAAVTSTSTMPSRNITLVAKYNVKYTVNVYKETAFGSGTYGDPVATEGSDIVGATVSPTVETPSNYESAMNENTVTSLTLSKTASENVFNFYFDICGTSVVYEANSTSATGTMDQQYLERTSTLTLPDCGYSLEGYRFLGWSTTAAGTVEYAAGASYSLTGETAVFYAVWDKGYSDKRFGSDMLYVDVDDNTKIYLVRDGLEEKTGTYNADTMTFSFTINANTTLTGKLLSGYQFCYDDDTWADKYYIYSVSSTDGSYVKSTDSIELKSGDEAIYTYTDENGDVVTLNGTYSYTTSGIYTFTETVTSEDDTAETVVFKLVEIDETAGTLGAVLRGEEAGTYYYYSYSYYYYYIVILDGFGGTTCYYYMYYSFSGTYTALGDNQFYAVWSGLGYATIKVGYSLSGYPAFLFKDSYAGTYTYTYTNDADTEVTDTLVLDGFSGATYTAADGTVTTGYYSVYDSSLGLMDIYDSTGSTKLMRVSYSKTSYTFKKVGNDSGYYYKYSNGYLYAIILEITDDTGATLYTYDTTNGELNELVTGTYASVTEPEGSYEFTAVTWAEDADADDKTTYTSFIFQLSSVTSSSTTYYIFQIYDSEMAGVVFSTADYTFTFTGYSGVTMRRTSNSTEYTGSYTAVKCEEDENFTYTVVYITVTGTSSTYQYAYLVIKVKSTSTEVAGETYVVDTYACGVMRVYSSSSSSYTYYYASAYSKNTDEYDARIVLLDSNYALIMVYDETEESYVPTFLGKYEGVENEDGITEYTFTIDKTRTGTSDAVIKAFTGYKFVMLSSSSSYLYLNYDESRVKTITGADGSTITFNEYGLVKYTDASGNSAVGVYSEISNTITVTLIDGTGTSYKFLYTNADKKTYKASSAEDGVYYNYSDGSLTTPYMMLESGTVTLYSDSSLTVYGTGTYTKSASSEEYTMTYTDTEDTSHTARFMLGTYTSSSYSYYVYILADDTLVIEGDVLAIDKTKAGTFSVDAYGNAEYYDAATYTTYTATYSTTTWRGNTIYIIKVTDLGETMYCTYTADGEFWQYSTEANYNFYGYDGTQILDTMLYLDGRGNATIVDSDGETVESGTYVYDSSSSTIAYTKSGETTVTTIALMRRSYSSSYIYLYIVQTPNTAATYVADDWSVLVLDGYEVSATYTTTLGVVYSGSYTVLTDGVLRFTSSSLDTPLIFSFNYTAKTFSEYTEDYVAENGVLLAWADYTEETVTLPSTITKIDTLAFEYFTALKSISMPGVTEIGGYAFYGCTSLTTVTAASVTTIGMYAFYSCTALTTVTVGTVADLGSYAFYGCESLNTNLTLTGTIGAYAFYGCSALTEVSTTAVTSVGNYAFYGCTALATADLSAVTTIDNYAFYNTALTSVTLTAVKTIGSYAFAYAGKLASAYIGADIESIGYGAFGYANYEGESDQSFTLTFSSALSEAPEIGEDVFYGIESYTVYVADEATLTLLTASEDWADYIDNVKVSSAS